MVIDPWVLDKELNDWVQGGGRTLGKAIIHLEPRTLFYHTILTSMVLTRKSELLAEALGRRMQTRSTVSA